MKLKDRVIKRLIEEEGFRDKPYRDTMGNETIGYGFVTNSPIFKRMKQKHGNNYKSMLNEYVDLSMSDANKYLGQPEAYPESVQLAVNDMAYNLGGPKLSGFKKMKQNLAKRDFKSAGKEMMMSDYAKQLPNRAKRNYELMVNS